MRRLIFKEIPAQPSSGDGIRDGIEERSTSAKADTVNRIFRADGISVMEVSESTAGGTCFARQNMWI